MSKKVEITVLMTVYNGEPYLREAVGSVLNQTHKEFEFLILDNVSTDQSREIIQSYNDPRIRLICNEENLGQTGALNSGLRLASGEFIARMDADDICHPERLEAQINYLRKNPTTAAVGLSNTILINGEGKEFRRDTLPLSNEEVRKYIVYDSPLTHSSVMIRKDAVESVGCYDEGFKFCQDWNLWSKLAANGFALANLASPVHFLRIHQSQTSHTFVGDRREIEFAKQFSDNLRAFTSTNYSGKEISDMSSLLERFESLNEEESLNALRLWESLCMELYGSQTGRLGEIVVSLQCRVAKSLLLNGRNLLARDLYRILVKSNFLKAKHLLCLFLTYMPSALQRFALKFWNGIHN